MKKIVLIFVEYYLPGHKAGGPVRTISNLVDSLGDDFDFRIVTSDRDLLDSSQYKDIDTMTWIDVGKSKVFYVESGVVNFSLVRKLIGETKCDFVYLNSLFSIKYTIYPLMCYWANFFPGVEYVVAPRGELSNGALSIKPLRKKLFLWLMNFSSLLDRVKWQASSEDEGGMIKKAFPNASKITVARDLPDCKILDSGYFGGSKSSRLEVLFLSRISPMKNLDFALNVLSKVDVPVNFDIWGTEEDVAYWRSCRDIISGMPSNVTVNYLGCANHADVPDIMRRYDLFFLPTRGENYGHVIAESLSVGTPVLISNRTPWRDLFSNGAGWDLPLEDGFEPFVSAIKDAYTRSKDNSETWRADAYAFAKLILLDMNALNANRFLFN